MRSKLRMVLMAALWIGLSSVRLEPAQAVDYLYELVDLGPAPRFQNSGALDVNESGQAAGHSEALTATGCVGVATRWSSSGSAEVLIPPTGLITTATGINANGDVVGWIDTGGGFPLTILSPFLWSGGVLTMLAALPAGDAEARAINDSGMIVGVSKDSAGTAHAVVWQGTTPTAISIPGAVHSLANDVNASGKVAGTFAVPGPPPLVITQAFTWEAGTGPMLVASPPGAYMTEAYAINNKGDLAGLSYAPGTVPHATLWQANGSVLDLGTPGSSQSYAADVNDSGDVVGEVGCDPFVFCGKGFLWRNGTMLELDSLVSPGLGWKLHGAAAISNSGYIVGKGTAPNGTEHGYLLKPIAVQSHP